MGLREHWVSSDTANDPKFELSFTNLENIRVIVHFISAAVTAEALLIPFSLITGQLLHFTKNELQILLTIILTLVSLFLNVSPAVCVVYSWANQMIKVSNITFTINVQKMNNSQLPPVLFRRDLVPDYNQTILSLTNLQESVNLSNFSSVHQNMTNLSTEINPLNDKHVIDNLKEFESYVKLVIAFFVVSSALSFIFIIFALTCTYKLAWLRRSCQRRQRDEEAPLINHEDTKPLDPFPFSPENKNTSTRLDLPESLYFVTLFLLNLIILFLCVYFFVQWHYFKQPYYGSKVPIGMEGAVFGAYMYSLLCTIVSCFIFSKLAYSVTNKYVELYEYYKAGHTLDELLLKDDQFTETAQATLNFFEFWFTIHWLFYTVTSFLSIALFLDVLTRHIQSTFDIPPDRAIAFSLEELGLVGLFTLQHCFLFLYPCFKAAAVTVSREKLIKKVNAYRDERQVRNEDKQFFIQYLKNKKFGFRISFFCARLRFGFNIAYISIFMGLLGVLLKLTGVII